MPIKRTKLEKVPSGKKFSQVQLKAFAELKDLQNTLSKNPLGPFEVIEVSLEPIGKSKLHVVNTFIAAARDWFKTEKKEFVAFSRTIGTGKDEKKSVYIARKQDVELSPKGRVKAYSSGQTAVA